ncbi:MAG: NAD(P)/FAD-dependent oxidoreductase [Thermoleophilia bacterium]|nr:NAD(P)/FAD-dependent oxidoreductase [Thermoleophilia bacterium]
MSERFDAVVLGAGPGGEVALNTLLKGGQRVALVEENVIGGECTNWGCIPTKTLLRPPELKGKCERAAGVETPALDFRRLAAYRDYMVSNHDDSARIDRYQDRGVTVVKARGRLAGPGRVQAAGRAIETDAVVVATGSEAIVPPIPGLAEAGYWTNREAADITEIPESAVVIGGGAVGIELAQFLARFGARVTVVQGGERLAEREDERIGELLFDILTEDGIEIRLGVHARSVDLEGGERVVSLDDGSEARGEVLLVATGRRPRLQDLGLETVGVEPTRGGIPVDERCRAGEGVWAIGDVTGVAMFTHVAKYQGRIAAADILGHEVRADYRAVPRVTFTNPEVAAVGMSEADARAAGIDVATATIELPTTIARPYTFEENPTGTLGVVVDAERGVLVGAWAVAPLASEWIHQAVLAIRAEIPTWVLRDTIAQFPSFSEAFGSALRMLPDAIGETMDHRAHAMIDAEGAAAGERR